MIRCLPSFAGVTVRALPRVLILCILAGTIGGCAAGRSATPERIRVSGVGAVPAIDPLPLIREAADVEALYTLAGGLKPMSSGFWRGAFEVEAPDLVELEQVRHALGVLRNDAWYADVQVFARAHDGERVAQAFVVHREALQRMIRRHAAFWNPWGITCRTHPAEIVAVVDRMPKADRWRGYGHLFGYPDAAVDFFVTAGLAAEEGGEVGPGKDRRFVQIPTHAHDTGRFTYAVPPDHAETAADAALAARAGEILAAYREGRSTPTDTRSMIEMLQRLDRRFGPPPLATTSPAATGDDHAVLDPR